MEKRVLNPGAVGIPLRSDGMTPFMMLHGDDDQWAAAFISLPYDREAVIREMDSENAGSTAGRTRADSIRSAGNGVIGNE